MATRLAICFVAFLFLFLFTISHARDLQNPESEPKPQQHDTVSLSLDSLDAVPLTILSFRPIDRRHFRPLPLSLRGCRHCRQIHYGNDAIVLSDASTGAHRPFLRSHDDAVQRLPEMMDRHDVHHHYRRHAHGHHHHHHGWFAEKVREFMNLF